VSEHATILVRVMSPEDATTVAALAGELGYPASASDISTRYQAIERDPDARLFVAQNADGVVVGWIHVQALHFLESDARGEIEGLVVAASARRTGVGRLLVRAAEDWTISRGLRLIGVRSNQVRTEAKMFYERIGFGVVKTQNVFRKTLTQG
jgi:GNAT superfamily N-acetyltransferase